MRKYIRPVINVEDFEIKEVIAALSNATENGFNTGVNEGKDVYDFSEFWN